MSLSDSVYDGLCKVIPGGVNSPFRAFHLVGGKARVMKRGLGSRIWDLDDKEYIDLCCAWGPLTLGHAHPAIVQAVSEAVAEGAIFGAPNKWELEMAERLIELVPSMEMVRFVNSGAEAVMSSLRVARSVTGRPKIVKFEGCYHGHVAPLDAVGKEAEESGGAVALGTTRSVTQDTLLAEFNNISSVEALFQQYPDQIACLILEPVTGSMGVIEAERQFLLDLKRLCQKHQTLLIFDEVLSGFRVDTTAQKRFEIEPDLTCLGKAVAGGLPVGAYGGKREFMEKLSPLGPIYQAGTFCGNPITMRAGIAALKEYSKPDFFKNLEARCSHLCNGLAEILRPHGGIAPYCGGMFSVGFGVSELRNHREAFLQDTDLFSKFFHAALAEGVYLPPSTFDAASVSSAHSQDEIDLCLEKLKRAADVL